MKPEIVEALRSERTIDITTIGRKSGQPRRIEIWFHNLDDAFYITGTPGRPCSWYANLVHTPEFTFHLKGSVKADLAALARPIRDESERRQILDAILAKLGRDLGENRADLEAWVAGSPLVAVTFVEES